ncbi:MAG: UrcA family protein [Gammaproteobacteria bacterium]|nr:UrcA family protein [Gammaproteobacteria bacterium]
MLRPEISRSLLVGPLAALLVALAPAGASADESAMIRKSVSVRVTDLDLSRPADAARLQQRIRRAAVAVCSDGLVPGSPAASEPDRDCMASAIVNALASVGSATVAYAAGSK